jgi:hypothetical protein
MAQGRRAADDSGTNVIASLNLVDRQPAPELRQAAGIN